MRLSWPVLLLLALLTHTFCLVYTNAEIAEQSDAPVAQETDTFPKSGTEGELPQPLDDKEKAKLDRLISVAIDMRGNGQRSDGEELADGQGGEHVYMATYDATNVAKQWQNLGIVHETQVQHKLISETAIEKEKFLPKDSAQPQEVPENQPEQEAAPQDSTVSSSSVEAVSPSDSTSEGDSDVPAKSESEVIDVASTEPPRKEAAEPEVEPTTEQKVQMKESAASKLTSSTFQELTPFNVMHFVHHHQPFLILNLCDCWRDAMIVDHLAEAEKLMTEKGHLNQITRLYIKPDIIAKFRLQEVYQFNEKIVALFGASTTKASTRRIFFGLELDRIPSKQQFEVEIVEECCGDRFSITIEDITREWADITIERADEGQNDWGQELKVSWRIKDKPHYQVPLLVIDNIPLGANNEKFIYQPHQWESEGLGRAQGLANFVEGFFLKKDAPALLVRSQPLQLSPPPAAHTPGTMLDLIGQNFNDVVLDASKDVLLMIFSPNCGASMAIMPLFQQAAEALKDDANVVVARIDKTRNDLNVRDIGVYYYPTVYLFPAGENKVARKLDFSDFNGSKEVHDKSTPHSHFSLQSLTKFVREHGGTYDNYLAPPISSAASNKAPEM